MNEKSAKGLEFDLVFYVGLEGVNTEQTGGLNERMAMYVMASRAREELVLCFKDIDLTALPPPGLSLLPPPKYRLCLAGGLRDLRRLFRRLDSAARDAADDGVVHRSEGNA